MAGSAPFESPLSFSYSILIVVPYIISLVAISIICFAVSYTVLMRQEIRFIKLWPYFSNYATYFRFAFLI
jgi:hypothetical protein